MKCDRSSHRRKEGQGRRSSKEGRCDIRGTQEEKEERDK